MGQTIERVPRSASHCEGGARSNPVAQVRSDDYRRILDRCLARDRVEWVMVRQYYVYLMTNPRKTVLYTGVTNNLERRVWQHRNGQGGRFTGRYNCSKLVLYEVFKDAYNAITREKQIKAGSRRRKVELIERMNPEWRDLYDEVIARAKPEAIRWPTCEAAGLPRGPTDRSQ